MSGYTFSHQFPQRWLQAPDSVRGAIVQELKDIMTLLRTDTAVTDFAFTHPDLNAYLDEQYVQDAQQQQLAAEQEQAEQEKERLKQEILDKQRLNRERLEKERQDSEKMAADKLDAEKLAAKKDQQDQAEKNQLEKDQLAKLQSSENQPAGDVTDENADENADKSADKNATADKTPSGSSSDQAATLTIVHHHPVKPHDNEQKSVDALKHPSDVENGQKANGNTDDGTDGSTADIVNSNANDSANQDNTSSAAAPVAFDSEQEAFVQELESHIDDYLSEQMTQLSETLKAWLREEVRQQLDRLN